MCINYRRFHLLPILSTYCYGQNARKYPDNTFCQYHTHPYSVLISSGCSHQVQSSDFYQQQHLPISTPSFRSKVPLTHCPPPTDGTCWPIHHTAKDKLLSSVANKLPNCAPSAASLQYYNIQQLKMKLFHNFPLKKTKFSFPPYYLNLMKLSISRWIKVSD